MPTVVRSFRARGVLAPLREDLAHTRPEPRTATEADLLIPTAPAAATHQPPRRPRPRRRRLADDPRRPASASRSAARCAGSRCSRRAAACSAPDRTTSRSTGRPSPPGIPPELIGPAWRLSLRAGDARGVALARAADGDGRSTPTSCRSRASRGGRRPSAGQGPPDRRPRARSSARARARPSTVQSVQPERLFRGATLSGEQVSDPARCSRSASTASTSRPTTAIPRGSSPRACRASTAPSGSGSMSFQAPERSTHENVPLALRRAPDPPDRAHPRRSRSRRTRSCSCSARSTGSTGSRGSSPRRSCTTSCCCRCTRRLTAQPPRRDARPRPPGGPAVRPERPRARPARQPLRAPALISGILSAHLLPAHPRSGRRRTISARPGTTRVATCATGC